MTGVQTCALPIYEVNQHGKNFGEKFCNAIEYCFGSGYNNLITIGSDCAGLSAKDILKASSQFQNNIQWHYRIFRQNFYHADLLHQ